MTLQAEIRCPECQELIKDVDSLDAEECPWCGAFLVHVDLESSSSKPSEMKAAPGLFDDITVSDDESIAMPKLSKAKHSSKTMDDEFSLEDILNQFKQEQKRRPKLKARSKRKQVALSDSSDDEWSAPTPNKKKNKMVLTKKKRKVDDVHDFDVDLDEDLDEGLDAMDHKLDVKNKHYSLSFSSDSGSEYHQSDSEDEPLPKTSKHAQKETKKAAKSIVKDDSGPTRKMAKVNKGKGKGKSETASTTSVSLPSSSSSPRTASSPIRAHAYLQFNKEMRGKLAKENKDLSSKDISRLLASLWNKMGKRQKASYANKILEPKRVSPPSGNGFLLYKKEQFSSIQKEYKLKGESAMANASSIIGVRWKNLDPNIKETYNLRAKKIREDWAIEHPVEYETFMDSVKEKISKAKKANRNKK